MIFAPVIKGLAGLCLTATLSPAPYVATTQLCQQYQQQYFPGYSHSELEKAIAQNNRENTARKKAEAASSRWYSSWEPAWKAAREQGKPLVCLFVHQGCPECDKMNSTLRKPAAAKSLSSAIKVKLEFSRNPSLVRRWGIKYTPTFLVFSPAHNGEVYREVGALSVDRLRTLQPSIEGLVTQPHRSGASERESSKSKIEAPATAENTNRRTMAGL